jgi:3'(2'), 5'-bisphosphate nucleotidase
MNYKIQDIQFLIDLALSAGKEIMRVYSDEYNIKLKDDRSPLTLADTLSDELIKKSISHQYPDIFYFSEESSNAKVDGITTFFLVDPLDGTKEFIKKNGEFTVNIALIIDSCLEIGVVYAPALNELYYGSKKFGAHKIVTTNHEVTENIIKLGQDNNYDGPLRVIASRSHASDELNIWLDQLEQDYELKNYGSSLKFCRLAEGEADIYPRFGLTSQWDTAAGHCILRCAGGDVLDQQHQFLEYGFSRPILNPNFIAYRTHRKLIANN